MPDDNQQNKNPYKDLIWIETKCLIFNNKMVYKLCKSRKNWERKVKSNKIQIKIRVCGD